jgi:hypothetical protein
MELYRQNPAIELRLVLLSSTEGAPGLDPRLYNMPTADEVAAIRPGDGREGVRNRDIVLTTRQGGGFQRIYETHRAHAPLHYILLFPHGTNGWTFTDKQADGITKVCPHPLTNTFS